MTTKIKMNGKLYTPEEMRYIGQQLKVAGLPLNEKNVAQWERDMAAIHH